jgi:hypothetical protein
MFITTYIIFFILDTIVLSKIFSMRRIDRSSFKNDHITWKWLILAALCGSIPVLNICAFIAMLMLVLSMGVTSLLAAPNSWFNKPVFKEKKNHDDKAKGSKQALAPESPRSKLFSGSPRDPARIAELLSLLQAYWKRYPDLRLGQLVGSFTENDKDPYFLEDEELIKKLKEELKR